MVDQRKIVLIDMDDTICDVEKTLKSILLKEFRIEIDVSKKTEDVSPEYSVLSKVILKRKNFYCNLPSIEEAIKAVRELNKKYDVFICTSHIQEKFAWIDEYLPELNGKIIITKDKTLIKGDYLIGTDFKTGITKPQWTPIIFNQPFNTQLEGQRINTWNEIEII